MANLRGGTFQKQVKDAFHRTLAFKESRHMNEDNLTHSLKQLEVEKGRYIQNVEQKLDALREIRYESYTIAKLQAGTGLRVNEAMEVIKNFEKYYNPENNTLEGVIGKGNHQYAPKEISYQLAQEVQKIENIPHYNTYNRDLKEVGINRSHDFRVTYAKDLLEHKLEQGKEYKESLKEVSQEINHHRPEMTEYYLNRA